MKPNEYLKKYDLLRQTGFNHISFVEDLGTDFNSVLQDEHKNGRLNADRFEFVISEVRKKFDAISRKSKVPQLTWDKLWGFFFATKVAPTRDLLFKKTVTLAPRKAI